MVTIKVKDLGEIKLELDEKAAPITDRVSLTGMRRILWKRT